MSSLYRSICQEKKEQKQKAATAGAHPDQNRPSLYATRAYSSAYLALAAVLFAAPFSPRTSVTTSHVKTASRSSFDLDPDFTA